MENENLKDSFENIDLINFNTKIRSRLHNTEIVN